MMTRPIVERQGRPLQLTANETKLLDDLWLVGQEINKLEHQLDLARKRREKLVRKTRERRFLLREIAEIGSLSHAGVCYILNENERKEM